MAASSITSFAAHAQHPLKSSPTTSKFKIGLCQLSVSLDKNQNLIQAHNSIKFAAEKGARLVVLPEMWNCPYSNDYFAKYKENFDDKDDSPSFSMLLEVASCHGITIVGGSMPEWNNDLFFNTCCVFGPDGKVKAKHRKLHLFDIDIQGDIQFGESDTFAAGDKPTIVATDLQLATYPNLLEKLWFLLNAEMGHIGVGICHDIRFPELAMLYRSQGAHLICYPGAFNMSTGELLWELVQRARAADNQLFVATCSPSRDSIGSYMIWGHSTLAGPCGEIIATSSSEETVVVAEIDYSAIQHQRENLPLEKQRRRDIYKFIDSP